MSDPDNPTQPLVRSPSQHTAVTVGAPAQGQRPSRAYKIAGVTLLACVLIVGQAMIAYFLLSQRNDIKALQEHNDELKQEMTKGRSASVPMKMHLPMNSMLEVVDDKISEEASTGGPEKSATPCQLEATGLKPVQVPGFRPACDKNGLYQAKQCFMEHCWCVNLVSGEEIPGSMNQGQVVCSRAVFAGSMSKVLELPDIDA
ncbi:CD74 molecule, major histocompatibility complex, class II invariant chain b [Parambassis ranga]|uniref:CD74 molecule, major histocompatibility complex, class II invariant chain b n=1 Tax=Parambassis ranga TaxID=210632 RepID=A0A6P7JRD5_9TELE|nr:uncharacterized protein LOC114447463 [Parambassis ranga]